jgi:uncharacterized protein (TIGR00251 family)
MPSNLDALAIVATTGEVEFTVKVVPGASRTRVVGVLGSALKVAVTAPPEAGEANAAVAALLASVFGVKKGDVTILSGHAQPLKRVAVVGVTPESVRARLAAT